MTLFLDEEHPDYNNDLTSSMLDQTNTQLSAKHV